MLLLNRKNVTAPKKSFTAVLLSTALMSGMLLSGCSSTIANITGASPVGVQPGDRTIAQRLRDGGIERNAKVNLYKLDSRFEKRARVNVAAFHDVVLLTGQVPDPHLVGLASQSVKSIHEVKAVHNELKVAAQASYSEIMQDSVTKTAIRKNLLLLPNFNESRAKVVVERGHVYVMGRMTESERKLVLETIQKSDNIVKIISLIDIIDEAGNPVSSVTPTQNTVNLNSTAVQAQPKLAFETPVAKPAVTTDVSSPELQRQVVPVHQDGSTSVVIK